MKKKVLSILLATALVATMLAGCSSSSSSSSDTTEATEEEEEEEEEAEAVETDEAEETEAAATDAADLPDASGDPAVTLVYSGTSFQAQIDAEEWFSEMVNEASGGTITIDYHPNNELGDDIAVITSVAVGDIDIGITTPSAITTMIPDLSVFDAFYVITDYDMAYAVMDGEVGQALAAEAEELGMKQVAWCENGFRQLTVTGRDIQSVEDLKGLKIRTMQNDLQMAGWSAVGTNPTPMAFTEVFTALQNGTIEAQENPIGLIVANSFMDVCTQLIMTGHIYSPLCVYMNLDKYNSLTDAQRTILDYYFAEMQAMERAQDITDNDEAVAEMIANGVDVVYPSDEFISEIQTAANEAGVYDQVRASMDNPDLFDKVCEICGVDV